MSVARIVILAIALVAGLGAALLIRKPSAPTQVASVQKAPTVPVLVAAADIPLGNTLGAADMRWLDWPAASVPAGVIRQDEAPEAATEFAGQLARVAMVASEPIRREKLIRTDGTGFLSAVLPSGLRAAAISTDSRGAHTAGGFVLPNDRVDVVLTSKVDGADTYSSETIISNVRVLAIGQNVQERDGEKVVIGETATLELDPRQVETVAQAQRSGTLSLALRSLKDAGETGRPSEEGSLTLVRYGVTTKSVKP